MKPARMIDRRLFLAGLGASTALAGCMTGQELAPAGPQSMGLAPDLTDAINAMMKGHIDGDRITGGVTAVARGGKTVHFAAHGLFDREAGTPMRTDGLFRMMSSTKPVTGVAVLQQQEEGRLSLDDKVSKFIPELKQMVVWKPEALEARAAARRANPTARLPPHTANDVVPANREITLRDLATHTSGLNGSAGRGDGPNTLANNIPRLKDVPLDFQPGTRWAYSATTGPDVLARVVEITSGQTYDRYLRERIFEPVGMQDTAHNLNPEQRTRLVPRYAKARDGSGAWQKQPDLQMQTTYFAGSYGLSSSAMDYLQFETMLLNKGTIHGKRVLKPESVELMSSNLVGDLYRGIGNQTRGTGFGVQVRVVLDPATCGCGRSKGGFGWGGAYGTMSWTDPEEKLVAVLMIQQSVNQVQSDFEQVIRRAIVSKI
jgi:CubicO group peptidase (beta-lactamase class C family)